MYRILTINPGSTSTKLAIFEDDGVVAEITLRHDLEVLSKTVSFDEKLAYRKEIVLDWLMERGEAVERFHAISARGGLSRPLAGGTYTINQTMLSDLRSGVYGVHPCNLAAHIAWELTNGTGIPCFVVDPVVVDEMEPIARLSGHPLFQRHSVFHALNQKAVARRAALMLGKTYETSCFVIAHMGGGISVVAHRYGLAVDVCNGVEGDGTYTPERSGALPAAQLAKLCYDGGYERQEVFRMIMGDGGVSAYLGTNDMQEVEWRVESGDESAALVFYGMAYQVAKDIGAYAAALGCRPDAILLTGGIAHAKTLVDAIISRVEWMAPIMVFPGEEENRALAEGARRVLSGIETVKTYYE